MTQKEKVQQTTIISSLEESDIPQLRTIGLGIPKFTTRTDTPSFYSEEALSRMAQSPECVALVAKVGDEIAGFALTSLLTAARDAYIHTVAVTEKFRGQGLAVDLLRRTLNEIRVKQPEINHVFTDIQVENEPSISLFKKLGFDVGRKFYYVDTMFEEQGE